MEYYWTVKKENILPFVTAWMDLENIMLSEINQAEKDKDHMISHIRGIKWTKWPNKESGDRLIDGEHMTAKGRGGWGERDWAKKEKGLTYMDNGVLIA